MSLIKEKALGGLCLIKEAILEEISKSETGIGNNDIARSLGLESDVNGSQTNYLTRSIINMLEKEGKISSEKISNRRFYKTIS